MGSFTKDNITYEETGLPSVISITPRVFGDKRGEFFESYSKPKFTDAGITTEFVQDNHSESTKPGTFRGLHIQMPSYQEKLVRVVAGEVEDYAVLSHPEGHPQFGKWISRTLNTDNRSELLIGQSSYLGEPVLYTHGFCVTHAPTTFLYKASDVYTKKDELGLNLFDPQLKLKLPDLPGVVFEKESMVREGLLKPEDAAWPNLVELAEKIHSRLPNVRKTIDLHTNVQR